MAMATPAAAAEGVPKMLHLSVTTNKSEFPYQVRYPATMAFVEFKIKLELVVGIYAQDMRLELRSPQGKFLAELYGDGRTLEELGIADNSIVHVHDLTGNSPAIGQLPQDAPSSATAVPHYVMPDEKYESRKDSLRKWKQELLSAQQNSPKNGETDTKTAGKVPASIQVGKRCIVQTRGQPRRFAQIAFVGPTHFGSSSPAGKEGSAWVGVVYEQPVGKNDGSLDGHRYFTCPQGHGGFVRPSAVEVLEEDGHVPGEGEGVQQLRGQSMEEI